MQSPPLPLRPRLGAVPPKADLEGLLKSLADDSRDPDIDLSRRDALEAIQDMVPIVSAFSYHRTIILKRDLDVNT